MDSTEAPEAEIELGGAFAIAGRDDFRCGFGFWIEPECAEVAEFWVESSDEGRDSRFWVMRAAVAGFEPGRDGGETDAFVEEAIISVELCDDELGRGFGEDGCVVEGDEVPIAVEDWAA
jgi:hypothetical protein